MADDNDMAAAESAEMRAPARIAGGGICLCERHQRDIFICGISGHNHLWLIQRGGDILLTVYNRIRLC